MACSLPSRLRPRGRVYPRTLFFGAILVISLVRGGGADTYPEWKARVFTEAEQADPAISSETALSPAGDGIPNILKYAFGVDPHVDGSFALPKISTVNVTDPSTGVSTRYPVISYQTSTNAASDLYFVPEASIDLQNWVRGDTTFDSPSTVDAGDFATISLRAFSPVSAEPAFLRLRVIEGQTLPDDWQQTHFGTLGVDPNGDPDGDGESNFDEFLHGTDPNSYLDGITAVLEIVSGNSQQGFCARYLPAPVVVRLSYNGAAEANVPIKFSVTHGGAQISSFSSGLQDVITTVTDTNGLASISISNSASPNETSLITVTSGPLTCAITAKSLGPMRAKVVAGDYDSMSLDANGSVWTWGDNSYGQLGDGTYDENDQPRAVSGVQDGVEVSAGSAHSLVVEGDGTVWGWGADSNGQLGFDTYDYRTQPAQIPNLTNIIAAAAGGYHSVFLKNDGTVWACGYNGDGELGNDDTTDSVIPVEVVTESGAPLERVIAVAAGYYHNLALRDDGTVWAWGANWNGMLGDGTWHNAHHAIQIPGLRNVTIVKAGAYHSVALGAFTPVASSQRVAAKRLAGMDSLKIWTWGANFSDQLGDGTYSDSPVPIAPAEFAGISDIAAGFAHTLVLQTDGTVAGWGSNASGETSGQSSPPIDTPTSIAGLEGITSIAAGSSHSLALAASGLIYSWGSNNDGQLGISEEQGESGPVVTSKDSNHSGMPDVWQIAHFGHTGIDGNADADGDGLTNAQEYRLGTDPNKSDSDGDDVPDGADGWPLTDVVSAAPVPRFHYAILDVTKTRIWGANNSPDGVIDYPADRNDIGYLPPYIFLENGDLAEPKDYNDSGQILATIRTATGLVPHAGIFPDTPIFVLGDRDETYSAGSDPVAINNFGQVLLNAHLDSPDHPGDNLVIWPQVTVFPRRPGGPFNNNADIASDNVLLRDGGRTDLPLHATAMTDRFDDGSEIVIGSPDNGQDGPILWSDGDSVSLNHQGYGSIVAWANNRVQLIGWSSDNVGQWLTLWQNGQVYRVDTDLAGAQPNEYLLFGPSRLNERGMFTAIGFHWGSARSTYLLMPVDLVVDANRDGQMSLTDRSIHDDDITSAAKPFRFWINDDDDTEITDDPASPAVPQEAETVPPLHKDSSQLQIVSKRNLEDFTRLWLYIPGLYSRIQSGEVRVALHWKSIESGSPSINIYPAADEEGSASYLTSDADAAAQITGDFNKAVNSQTIVPFTRFIFNSAYWVGLDYDHPKKCFLFEGVSEGKGELEFEFLDQNNNIIGHGGSLWLDLKNVRSMYQRGKAQPENIAAPNGNPDPPFTGPMFYYDDPISDSLNIIPDPQETNKAVLFVHGWSVDYGNYISLWSRCLSGCGGRDSREDSAVSAGIRC